MAYVTRVIAPPNPVVLSDDIFYQGTIFGAPPQWGDGNPASYAELKSYIGTLVANRYQAADTRLPAQPDIIASPDARVAVWYTAWSDHPGPVAPRISRTQSAFPLLVPGDSGLGPLPTTPGEGWSYTELVPDSGHTMEGFISLWRSSDVWLRIRPGFPSPDPKGIVTTTTQVYEARVVVYYQRPGLPPLRQFPRSDGLGTAPPRKWPPAPSRQASLRRHGGYW